MKKSIIFAATLLLLTMISCNQDSLPPSENPLTWDGGTRAEKNPLDEIDFSALDTVYFVTDKDVEDYIHFKELLAKGQGKEFAIQEVVPLGLNDEATLAYLLNYNEGWEIISADKRAPLVLAAGEDERFVFDEVPEETMAWIEGLEADILYIRTLKKLPEDVSKDILEKIELNLNLWNSFSSRIKNEKGETRAGEFDGYWELISSELLSTTNTDYPHLITYPYSSFHQLSPYNVFCPIVSSGSSVHAPTGCVAVAGSMMLAYLHDKTGVPYFGPDYAYYTGTIYNWSFSSHTSSSSTIWEELDNDNRAAALMAFVGHRVGMQYGANDSGAYASDLVDDVFSYFGINCSYNSFSTSAINTSLQNELPVIISAFGIRNSILGIYYYSYRHSFIVDSYITSQSTYRNTYTWHYSNSSNIPRPDIDDDIQIVVSSPSLTFYRMRWGGGGGAKDRQLYAPSGDWELQTSSGLCNFIYNRHIISGFSVN